MRIIKKYKYEHLYIDIDKRGLATVVLNRPEVRNAFNHRTVMEIKHLFKTLNYDDEVKAVVLQGSGGTFCAGADLNWMRSMIQYSFEENFRDAKNLAAMLEQIKIFSKPFIAKLEGAAIGGGSGISCLADYVIAENNQNGKGVIMGFPEPSLGIRPSTISPYVIERLGTDVALRCFLSGHIIHCKEAKQIGLIDELCSNKFIDAAVEKKVGLALKYGKRAFQRLPSNSQPPTNPQQNLSGNLAKIQDLVFNVVDILNDPSKTKEDLMNYTASDIAMARISDEGQFKMRRFLEKKKRHAL
ncbi:MAG: enoyl-CoA hydratase-related protein [Chitinophagales bacterium]|nr:enoyl-CoA hydratase-related protein [Chitinophagales bacterium]